MIKISFPMKVYANGSFRVNDMLREKAGLRVGTLAMAEFVGGKKVIIRPATKKELQQYGQL